jgi:hypothetical protein
MKDRFALFFATGNAWLLVALLLLVGKHQDRYAPDRYSFFEVGGSHTPMTYNLFVGLACIVGGLLVALAFSSGREKASR